MRLRVLSYNIHRAIGVDRRFQPARIASILDHHHADIALLQEVDEGVPRSREIHLAEHLAEALGYSHLAFGHNVLLRKGRYGNATLSRFPIVRERNIDLTVDGRKRRGCQHTTLDLSSERAPRRRLEVFNLHLGLSARERSRQLGLLVRSREFMGLTSDQPCIVGGDFNDWRHLLHPILVEILAFRCASRSDGKLNGLLRTYPALQPAGALDRIYYRGRLRLLGSARCRLPVSRVASDHRPILADLEIH